MDQWWKNSSLWYFLCDLWNRTLALVLKWSIFVWSVFFLGYVLSVFIQGILPYTEVKLGPSKLFPWTVILYFDLFLHEKREKWQLKVLGKWWNFLMGFILNKCFHWPKLICFSLGAVVGIDPNLFFQYCSSSSLLSRHTFHSCPTHSLAAGCWQLDSPHVFSCMSVSWQGSYLPQPDRSRFSTAETVYAMQTLLVVFSLAQGWTKMPVNCKLACDWLGAIQFTSKRFWFRKYSAILETSNIYFASFILPSVLDEVKFFFHLGYVARSTLV